MKKLYIPNLNIKTLPPAINSDGSSRVKNDDFDYGLNEYDAECEYHMWLSELKDANR
jgi:hypothetical protein